MRDGGASRVPCRGRLGPHGFQDFRAKDFFGSEGFGPEGAGDGVSRARLGDRRLHHLRHLAPRRPRAASAGADRAGRHHPAPAPRADPGSPAAGAARRPAERRRGPLGAALRHDRRLDRRIGRRALPALHGADRVERRLPRLDPRLLVRGSQDHLGLGPERQGNHPEGFLGRPVATLYSTAANRFEGRLASGQAISVSR